MPIQELTPPWRTLRGGKRRHHLVLAAAEPRARDLLRQSCAKRVLLHASVLVLENVRAAGIKGSSLGRLDVAVLYYFHGQIP